VPDDKTYTYLLNQMSGDDCIYRNLSAPMYSPLQEYLLLKHHFTRGHKPDHVVVLFCANDLTDNLTGDDRPHIKVVDGQPVILNQAVSVSHVRNLKALLKNNSLAWNHLDFYLMSLKLRRREERQGRREGIQRMWGRISDSDEEKPTLESEGLEDQYVALRFTYSLMRELCREHGVRLAIASEYGDERLWHRQSRHLAVRACQELSIPFFDLSERFSHHLASAEDGELVVFELDPHYNETGHRLLAEAIREELDTLDVAERDTPMLLR
jgi:lysophospholipase L1-like esterase